MPITKNGRAKARKARSPAPADVPLTRVQRIRALRGKFAFVPFSSEDHARQKIAEIEREG